MNLNKNELYIIANLDSNHQGKKEVLDEMIALINKLGFISAICCSDMEIETDLVKTAYFQDLKDLKNQIERKVDKIIISSDKLESWTELDYIGKSGIDCIINVPLNYDIIKILDLLQYNQIWLMHNPKESINLKRILKLQEENSFIERIGLNCDNIKVMPAFLSVLMGCNLLEIPFTLNKNMQGIKHGNSWSFEDFMNFYKLLYDAEKVIGKK